MRLDCYGVSGSAEHSDAVASSSMRLCGAFGLRRPRGEFRVASQAFPSIGAFHATVGDDSAIHPLHRIGCIGPPFD
jgi:hypothetical protein